jgi:hypothetical protein
MTTYQGISLKEGQARRTDFEKQRRMYPQRKKTVEERSKLKDQWKIKVSTITTHASSQSKVIRR